ncbi:hypothetical protein EV359DRAFT_73887 [Lentinula novae-zelandiae]|nr:hypothetical protein EV359DRAFT_73887 [Lentinula novae-zelandiae]
MCYPEGSVSHAVNDCPLCKAFVHSRCPHVREVCRNRALHPQLDVVYLKNAEVDWFNGCGYCKWARLNPSQKPGFPNPGWPGCCRAPAPSEYRMIQAADWRSISIVHHIPIPPEIKLILDGLTTGGRSSSKPRAPPAIPSFNKGSPDLRKSSLESRSPDLRPSVIPSGKSSPESRSPDSRSPESRSPALTLSKGSPDKGSPEIRPSLDRRRSSTINPPTPSSNFTLASRKASKNDDASSVASGGSGESDSLSDSTVTSDGGFTDYLSDESEAELQRQAEAKAALLAQNQAEELEFKAARQQLAHVDLRPPKSWNPTNITNSNTALRLTTTTKG